MTQQAAVPLATAWCEAFAGVGGPAVHIAFDSACQLHVPGQSGLAGPYQGAEAILGVLRRMADLTGGTLRFVGPRVLTADEHAVAVYGRATATRKGRRLDTDAMHVLALHEGKVSEIWMLFRNQDQVDRFWAT